MPSEPKYKVGQPLIFHGWLGVIRNTGYVINTNVTPPATIHKYHIDWITTEDKPQDIYPTYYAYDEDWVGMMVDKYNRRIVQNVTEQQKKNN